MKPFLPVLGALLALAEPVAAQNMAISASVDPLPAQGPVVVELYTSQGCSSCPPADALLKELAEREDVLPLALHVDYWDYIGWADTFANAKYTQRQKAYARAAGHRTIYTPQMVVEGEDHVVGYRPMEVADLIERHHSAIDGARVQLTRLGDTLEIRLVPVGAELPGPAVVQLVRFEASQTVSIARGENAGRTITYANVVKDWQRIGDWDGKGPVLLSVPEPGSGSVAVIVQAPGNGPILGAGVLK
jgi:hypothetical protein